MFLNCVVEIAPDRFTFQVADAQLSIPVFSSHPLENSNTNLEKLVVIVHGAGLNAEKSFRMGNDFVERLGASKDQYMVLAPQFLEGIETKEEGGLLWDRQWRSGGFSVAKDANEGRPRISSYEVMDRLIRFVTERNSGINQIIILGHSAGGQFTSRYAAMNNCHEELQQQGISMLYIVANPSSFLYLNATRYHFDSHGEIKALSPEGLTDCSGYNDYKYGLENLYGYSKALSNWVIRIRLATRPLVFLIGEEDTERSWNLDKSCAGELQGKNRYERALLYKHHLAFFFKDASDSRHHWIIIPGVGHNANEMFRHRTFINELKPLIY